MIPDEIEVSFDPYYLASDFMKPGNIIFQLGDEEVMRLEPGPPPRIVVANGVEVSEAAKAVLDCIEHMLFQARWNRPQ